MLHGLDLRRLGVARLAVTAGHFKIGRGGRPRRPLALALALTQRIHDPEIMLGVLIEVFRRDPIAGGLRLPRQRDITLENLISIAPDFYAWPVAVESLGTMRRARPVAVMRTATTAVATT